ncbi:hypothetical protein [Vitreimonas flagellata]|uniref:hypothetical protein n=1 Tax=Vitreimonas flagellata TaxID=2560861 RepID=UPI001075210F|nr:hypothetical protein [Vitreimonas flagellata]
MDAVDALGPERLELYFDVKGPIELTDLTQAFRGLAREYRRHLVNVVRQRGGKIRDGEIKLYITKVRSGSIIAELAGASQILGAIVSAMDYTIIFRDFVTLVEAQITAFRAVGASGKVDHTKLGISKAQCEAYADFLKVVAESREGNLSLTAAEHLDHSEDRTIVASFKFSADEALEARRGALITLSALEYAGDSDHKQVLMYFHQTNVDDPKDSGRTGDRAIIKAISDRDLPVYFASEIDRERIKSLWDDAKFNPFKASYRVDVNVEVDRNDKPRFYRVTHLHEILPDDSGEA